MVIEAKHISILITILVITFTTQEDWRMKFFFIFLLQLREFTAWIYKQCFDILIDDFPTNPNIIELFLCSSLWFHGFSWIFFKILLTRNIFRINLKALKSTIPIQFQSNTSLWIFFVNQKLYRSMSPLSSPCRAVNNSHRCTHLEQLDDVYLIFFPQVQNILFLPRFGLTSRRN